MLWLNNFQNSLISFDFDLFNSLLSMEKTCIEPFFPEIEYKDLNEGRLVDFITYNEQTQKIELSKRAKNVR